MNPYRYFCKGFIVLLTILLVSSCKNNHQKADAYGNFETDDILLSAEILGELLLFNIEEGDSVEAGELVGIIDTTSLFLQKEQLLAQKFLLSAKHENIYSQIDVQEEQLKNLVREKNRLDRLVAGNAATTQQLEDIEGKISVTQSQIKSIKTQYSSVEAERNMLLVQIKQVDNQLSNCKIINPVKGVVLEKYVMAHEQVNPGKSLYKLADISKLELKVYVSGSQLAKVKIGNQAKVFADKNEDELLSFPGVVSWVSSEVEFTPKIIQTRDERVNMVYAVKIRVKNDGTIKIGMPGEVIF